MYSFTFYSCILFLQRSDIFQRAVWPAHANSSYSKVIELMLSYKSLLTQLPFQIPQLPFFHSSRIGNQPKEEGMLPRSRVYGAIWLKIRTPPTHTHTHTGFLQPGNERICSPHSGRWGRQLASKTPFQIWGAESRLRCVLNLNWVLNVHFRIIEMLKFKCYSQIGLHAVALVFCLE